MEGRYVVKLDASKGSLKVRPANVEKESLAAKESRERTDAGLALKPRR